MAISKNKRFAVFERDAFTCQYCGRRAPDTELQADHIKPVSLGGDDSMDNLITSCKECNSGKGGRAVREPERTPELLERLAALKQRRKALRQCADAVEGIIEQRDRRVWVFVKYWMETRGEWKEDTGTCKWDTFANFRSMCNSYSDEEILYGIDATLKTMRTKYEDKALPYLWAVLRNKRQQESDSMGQRP